MPWVLPSPNMPTPDTAVVYPGTGMFEGVATLSEGRGTTRPFELIGGPGFDYRWCDRVAALDLPGVRFREAYFTPTFSKFANRLCAGIEIKVVDPLRYDPIRTAVAMLVEARKSPASGCSRHPSTKAGTPGPTELSVKPFASCKDRTRVHVVPATKIAPGSRVPRRTSTVATLPARFAVDSSTHPSTAPSVAPREQQSL